MKIANQKHIANYRDSHAVIEYKLIMTKFLIFTERVTILLDDV